MTVIELIEKEKEIMRKEYELQIQQLEDKILFGSIGDSQWLEEKLNTSFKKIKEIILYPFKKELQGHIIYYPEHGGHWKVNKARFNEWIVKNFYRINWEGK